VTVWRPGRLAPLATWLRTAGASVIVLMTGVGLSQVIAFLASPLLARLFSPEDFGELAVFVSVVGITSVVATGRMELAVPLGKDRAESSLFLAAGFWTSGAVSLTLGLLLAVAVVTAGHVRILTLLADWWWLIPLGTFMTAGWRLLNYWHTGAGGFRAIALSYVGRAFCLVGLQIAFAFLFSPGGWGLVVGNFGGQVAATLLLAVAAGRGTNGVVRFRYERREIVAALRANTDFLKYGSLQGLVNAISQNTIILVFAQLLAAAIVGQIAFALRILMFPVHLVADAIRRVVYKQLTDLDDRRAQYRVWSHATLTLGVAGTVMIVVVTIWGPAIFVWFLGPQWAAAGQFSRILVWAAAGNLCNPPSTMLIPVLGLQRWQLGYESLLLAARLVAVVLGAMTAGASAAITGYAAVSVVANLWLAVHVRRKVLQQCGGDDDGR